MLGSHSLTALLASALYLLRHHAEAEEEYRAAIELLRQGLGGPLILEVGLGSLRINEKKVALTAPGATELSEHLLLHGIGRATIPEQPDLRQLTTFLRVISAFPGTYPSVDEVLAAIGPETLRAFAVVASPDALSIMRYAPAEGVFTFDPSGWDGDHLVPKPRPPRGPKSTAPVDRAPPRTPITVPSLPSVSTRSPSALEAIVARGRKAVMNHDWSGVLHAALELLEAESEAPTEAAGNAYRIELKRLVPKTHLVQIARLATSETQRHDAIALLRRMGGDATEVLMNMLVEAMSVGERRGYYSAITQMANGTEVIIHHLGHPLWYVVRNAADLCGEMDIQRAVPDLARQMNHSDERVRRSVAGALARIGTAGSTEPLRRALSDPAATVRLHAARYLDGRRGRALTGQLLQLMDKEGEEEVLREVTLALGRIGTTDAIQALTRMAAPSHKVFGLRKKPLPHRLWAVEGLGLAGRTAMASLQALVADEDPQIGSAVRKALDSLPL